MKKQTKTGKLENDHKIRPNRWYFQCYCWIITYPQNTQTRGWGWWSQHSRRAWAQNYCPEEGSGETGIVRQNYTIKYTSPFAVVYHPSSLPPTFCLRFRSRLAEVTVGCRRNSFFASSALKRNPSRSHSSLGSSVDSTLLLCGQRQIHVRNKHETVSRGKAGTGVYEYRSGDRHRLCPSVSLRQAISSSGQIQIRRRLLVRIS